MFSRLIVPATLAALASTAAAQLKILSPGGPNLWWVAGSDNALSWTCHSSPYTNYTVLVGNQNPSLLVPFQAIIAQEMNYDCSKTITKDQQNFQPGSGYKVQLANPFNSTDVYAESEEFEIKPLGSAYPDPSATPTESTAAATGSGASGSGTAAGGAAQTSAPAGNGAIGLSGSLGGVAAAAAVALIFA